MLMPWPPQTRKLSLSLNWFSTKPADRWCPGFRPRSCSRRTSRERSARYQKFGSGSTGWCPCRPLPVLSWPSSHQDPSLTTQPDKVTETFLLPLRTVVASSSATLSSRSAQQSPPRSAALAGVALMAKPPSVIPSAAAMAMRLDVFVSPPTCPSPPSLINRLIRTLAPD